MIIVFFTTRCLFIFVFFVQVLQCTDEVANCGHPIKIYKDYECIHRFEDFESHVRVYSNDYDIQELQRNVTQIIGVPSRITSADLVAYPVLITGSLRYRADFHIEMPQKDLVDIDSILLVFTTREGGENGFVRKAAVVQRVTKLNGNDGEKYVRLGCYWHYNIFLATCEITINLEMTLIARSGSASYGKYYFRIPFWEQFNNENDVDPCLYAPFAYVEENEESDTEVVSVRAVNCTRPAFVKVEQRNESSGELMKTDVIYTDESGRGVTRLQYTKALHYYEAFFTGKALEEMKMDVEVSGELASLSVILISVLIPVMFIIVLVVWCLKEPIYTPQNSLLFLKTKPRVKFIYNHDSKFQVYRAQTETLILFMEKHCNIINADDSCDYQEVSKSSPLLNKFEILVLVPFPSNGEPDTATVQAIKQWERAKEDCIIMELPFWSGHQTALDEQSEPFTKWRRFRLMDEFLPLLTFLQRSRSCFQRRFLAPITIDDIRRKLEDHNLTNDGFAFCLKEALGHSADKSGYTAPPDGYPNLQEMDI